MRAVNLTGTPFHSFICRSSIKLGELAYTLRIIDRSACGLKEGTNALRQKQIGNLSVRARNKTNFRILLCTHCTYVPASFLIIITIRTDCE